VKKQGPKSQRTRAFDRRWLRGRAGLIGIDEAGRGALAGPVVAAAVALPEAFYESHWCRRNASSVNDSKQLTSEQREATYAKLRRLEREGRLWIGVGKASVEEIADENILGATQIAMKRALSSVLDEAGIPPRGPDPLFERDFDRERAEALADWLILVDGRPMKRLGHAHEAVVKGDGKSLCIAMASVVAKVVRDRLMLALDCDYPRYDLASSKGYATEAHRGAILRLGSTKIHRELFLRKLLEEPSQDGQEEFGF